MPALSPTRRLSLLGLLTWAAVASTASAQQGTDDAAVLRRESTLQPAARDRREQPAHYVATLGVGAPLRLSRNVDFDQNATGPLYTDVFGGYALAGSIRLRHGAGVGFSLNVTDEGGYTEPVGAGEQLVVMPAYFAFYDIDPDWMGLGHVGVPVLLTNGTSVGAELAAGLAYRLRAGLGLYGEAGLNVFPGADKTLHPTLSLELGVVVDYEVLP
jgi:hypothetical protein